MDAEGRPFRRRLACGIWSLIYKAKQTSVNAGACLVHGIECGIE